MPSKGKHRRPKSNSISRGFIAAGTGGAAIALPLIGATGAHAAEKAAPAAAPQAAPASALQAENLSGAQQRAETKQTAIQAATRVARTYTVVSGDCLSTIAADHHVRGGWHRLYRDNREAVGDNPSLIHPGLELTLGGRAAASAPSEAPAEPSNSSDDSAPSADVTPSDDSSTPSDDSAAPSDDSSAPSDDSSAPSDDSSAPSDDSSAPSDDSADSSSADSSSADSSSSGSTEEPAAPATEEAPAADTAEPSTGSGFTAPVDGPTSTPYGAAGSSWSSGYHTGVDFSASSGTPVKAVSDGTVVTAGWGGAYGNQIVIQHSDGMYSQYGHLSSLEVSAGESVSAGQEIGLSGSTGNSTGPHLHFEIRTGPEYGSDVDPVAYLRQNGVNV
ncbi:LysM peptidoglycan-binding domain-containing M23 family metallopeptidase [Streptomyces sp. NPDC094034]|uniref:M23 family metallopeptidase n=1 Tax=Streptomyces sp. NPDC094034 TaxID=3155309 RepID=UPI00332B689B